MARQLRASFISDPKMHYIPLRKPSAVRTRRSLPVSWKSNWKFRMTIVVR
jgi:hypothetical protein